MKTISNAKVVTRHQGLIQYLEEIGLIDHDAEVILHATPEQVAGQNVIGVLPHSLSCLCNTFTEIPMNIPAELRGKELTLEDMRQYGGTPVTYMVQRVS